LFLFSTLRGEILEDCPVFFENHYNAVRFRALIIEYIKQTAKSDADINQEE
jgi:hypothetical protein